MMNSVNYIGKTIKIKIDRPKGSKHPKFGFVYEVNYGFVPHTMSGDGEELDAYVLSVNQPLSEFEGRCIAVIHRINDNDDKLVVVPDNQTNLSDDEIERQTAFQEKWFNHIIVRNPCVTKTHFGVYGCVIEGGKILVIKKARGPYTGLYDLPGGSQENGETFQETLKREIKEETNCDVVSVRNERKNSVIFSDFTKESGEEGVLQHNAVLYDVEIKGAPSSTGDGLDSNGAVWMETGHLSVKNATPHVLFVLSKILFNESLEK